MAAYYNEIDPFAAAWLRELIKAGLIADGDVDERSIELVRPDDLRGYRQCHFFAGIGGWSYALRLAGWPNDRPVWTGSCPCQPFSAAGKGRGKDDARHLWPQFRRLIRQCRPATVFGEQVASKAGRVWLSAVFADLEALAYRAAGADLCGPCVGAWDIRQRLFFVADTTRERRGRERLRVRAEAGRRDTGELADVQVNGRGQGGAVASGSDGGTQSEGARVRSSHDRGCDAGGVGDGERARLEGQRGHVDDGDQSGRLGARAVGSTPAAGDARVWSDVEWLACTDGKWRPTQPGLFPLAHGVPARVGRLRGYGNAIKPPVAAAFIEAYCESLAVLG